MSSFIDRMGIGARKAKFEAERQKDILTLQTRIRPLNGKIDKVYSQLGRAAFEVYQAGRLDQPELAPIAGRLANLHDQIAQIEQEIEDIRNKQFSEGQVGQYGYICPEGHGPLPEGNNFCIQCGAKPIYVPPPAAQPAVAATFCQKCSNPLDANAQFCANCGHAVAQPQPAQPAPVASPGTCAHCGEPLMPDATFCSECGTPVAPAIGREEVVSAVPPAAVYEPREEVLFPPEVESGLEEEIVDADVGEAAEQEGAVALAEEAATTSTEEIPATEEKASASDLAEEVVVEGAGDEVVEVDLAEESELESMYVDEMAADLPEEIEAETNDGDEVSADLAQEVEAESAIVEGTVFEQPENDGPEAEEESVEPGAIGEATTNCANCGEELLPDALFCGECGHHVADEVEGGKEAAASEGPPDEAENDLSDESMMLISDVPYDQEDNGEPAAKTSTASTGFCANCGAVLLPDAVFCAECGEGVE